MFRQVGREDILAGWPVYGEVLLPAMRQSADKGPDDVLQRLMAGSAAMIEVVSRDVQGLVILDLTDEGGEVACWVSYIAGQVDLPPKAWLRAMRQMMAELEQLARRAGCRFMRIGGRDYRRIFPDYAPFDPKAPNRLQKVLLDG